MDIAALKAFVAIADSGTFSQAAEQLYLTQPAISKRIAALEQELGARLFDRIGRRVSLTEAGSALLPRARRILLELEDSVRALGNLSGEVHGPLRFGTSHHIGLHRLPAVLKEFVQAHPDVRLDIRFMDSEAACEAVEHGELELAIVTLPPAPASVLQLHKIWDDPLAPVVSIDHPLAAQPAVSLDDLASHPVILPAIGTYTREIVEAAFRDTDLQLDIALSTNYLETIQMLVSVGMGWSLLPRTMQDAQTRTLQVDSLSLTRALGSVHHRDRTLSNAAHALMALLV